VDTKDPGGLGLISSRLGEGALNEFLLELVQSFVQIYAAFDHFRNKGLQLLFHNFFLRVASVLLLLPPPTLERAVTD
jgi:hypothetical protein